MPTSVDRRAVQRLVADGAQLVEVLPAEEFDEDHLPGAISLPIREFTAERAGAVLDPGRPVVVYCWDSL